MKLRSIAALLFLLATVFCAVGSAGPIAHYCKLHPTAPLCN